MIDKTLFDIVSDSFVEQDAKNKILTPYHTAKYLSEHGVTIQKHGRWKCDEESAKWGFPFVCSNCGKAHDYKEPYCPNCGAKMGGRT